MFFRTSIPASLFLVLFLLCCLLPGQAQEYDFPEQDLDGLGEEDVTSSYGGQEIPGYQTEGEGYGSETPQEPASVTPPIVPLPDVELGQKNVLIGRTPYLSLKEMMRQVSGLFAFLKREMGVKEVRLVTAKDYSSVLAALARGTIDFAWVGPMSYVIGKEKGNLMPIAKAQQPGGIAYRGVFITRRDDRVMGLDDIRGKTIGFVDPESASGYLYPLYLLKRVKINPHKVCSRVYFLKKHDAVLQAVLDGKIDVGVCLEATLAASTDPRTRSQILVLGRTDEIPSDVLVCRQDCPQNLRQAFLGALLKRTASGTAQKTGYADSQQLTFVEATEGDFEPVKAVWNAVRSIAYHP